MSGHGLNAKSDYLNHISQVYRSSTLPKQPWELPSFVPIFEPQKTLFQQTLSVPGPPQVAVGSSASASSQKKPRLAVVQASFQVAWTKAVSAKRHLGPADQRARAEDKVQALLAEFPARFEICDLIQEDVQTGIGDAETLRAVLAPKSPATVLKHVGPLRTCLRWMQKHCSKSTIDEAAVWSFVQCVLKDPKTAATTMATSLQSVRWSYHTLGLRIVSTVFISVRIKGAISGCLQGKNPWRPAPALIVVEVLHLRVIANDDAIDLVDRAGAAQFLAMLYGRCRASDIQEVSDLCWDKASEDSWSQGFIECRTLRHKTARMDERRKRLLPIVIPGRGIASKDFGDTLKQVRDLAGLPNQLDKVPLLPVPPEDNTWSDDALESAEISRWLQALLPRPQDHLTSHSLKATVLVWCCKFGLSRETRRILGWHADAVGGSDAVYGRDVQAQALRELEVVLEAVRLGHFRPDATRSGLFALNFSRDSLLQQAACQVPT